MPFKKSKLEFILFTFKHVVQENVVGGSSVIGLTLVVADSKQDMPGIKPGPPGWHTSALTTGYNLHLFSFSVKS